MATTKEDRQLADAVLPAVTQGRSEKSGVLMCPDLQDIELRITGLRRGLLRAEICP